MSKANQNMEGKGAITYWISDTEQITITSDMSPAQVASLQAEYWDKLANIPINRRNGLILPGEAEKIAQQRTAQTRFTEKAFLRFK